MSTSLTERSSIDVAEIKDRFRNLLASITIEADEDLVASAISSVDLLGEIYRELRGLRDVVVMDWLEANGDLEIGDVRYYVGTKRRTKVRDAALALEALLELTAGDLVAIGEAMVSEPFKQGHFRGLAGDETWEEHFRVEVDRDLKTGKPKKSLQRGDKRFLGGGR